MKFLRGRQRHEIHRHLEALEQPLAHVEPRSFQRRPNSDQSEVCLNTTPSYPRPAPIRRGSLIQKALLPMREELPRQERVEGYRLIRHQGVPCRAP